MPDSSERQEFFKDVQERKVQRAQQLRSKVAAKTPPSAAEGELKRLRKEVAELRAQSMKARQEAAVMLSQANRMAQMPPHVVKDFATRIMRALGS